MYNSQTINMSNFYQIPISVIDCATSLSAVLVQHSSIVETSLMHIAMVPIYELLKPHAETIEPTPN